MQCQKPTVELVPQGIIFARHECHGQDETFPPFSGLAPALRARSPSSPPPLPLLPSRLGKEENCWAQLQEQLQAQAAGSTLDPTNAMAQRGQVAGISCGARRRLRAGSQERCQAQAQGQQGAATVMCRLRQQLGTVLSVQVQRQKSTVELLPHANGGVGGFLGLDAVFNQPTMVLGDFSIGAVQAGSVGVKGKAQSE